MDTRHVLETGDTASAPDVAAVWCPFDLRMRTIARFVNAELRDHPVYAGIELQWFDDERHGRGMLAFLERRADRRVDYYAAPELHLDRGGYELGSGIGRWCETRFDADRLAVTAAGVVVDVRFTDVDGRQVEVHVDDRDVGPRRPGVLLAPVGVGIDAPRSLGLVWLEGFDLLRRGRTAPRITIDGELVATGKLPAAWLHRRHLIKAAAPLVVVDVCPTDPEVPTGPLEPLVGRTSLDATGRAVTSRAVTEDGHHAQLTFAPAVPSPGDLDDGGGAGGRWQVLLDGHVVTGGSWTLACSGDLVDAELEVDEPWRPPRGLPPLLAVVTRLASTFRRWPTTYRWRGRVDLAAATSTGRWERTGAERGQGYRRATGSGEGRS